MKYKNIVFIIPSLGDGGSQWVMVQLSNYAVSLNYNVDIITINANGSYKKFINNKVNVINLSKDKMRFAIIDIIKLIIKRKYETVISSQNYVNFITIILFKLFSKKSKIIIRESNTISKLYKPKNSLKYFLEFFFRRFYNLSNIIISPSQGVKQNLIEKFSINKNKITVINNPVDINLIIKLSNKNLFKEDDDLFNKPTIISIGRLTYQKNLQFLIKSFAEINTKGIFNLIILGEGPQRNLLEKQIKKLGQTQSIFLPGFKSNPFKFLKKSKALVLTSLWEGMPNVILNSIALNIPVISFDCESGPREILENGKYGSLIKINDSIKLKYQMTNALNNKFKYNYPKGLFLEKYSIESIGRKFSKLL